ncbi:MAG: thermonuclease family protein [Thiothrix sp.]|uniref:thermonuclease family protein n=1 Tax=Thiothrix sp. TaxID=1032 RepID=UPI0026235002|nr:thermonuclease family protein [Thiothrix sp.]MDD5392853.1 thermonuclease family protein [Thiothrix sp.]
MHTHINPSLQAYLLTAFLLVLLVVVLHPHGQYAISLMVAGALLAYVLLATLGQAGRVACRLASVEAADTLTLLHKGRKVRVRVYGIQAPDRSHPMFEASRQALEQHLQGQELAFLPTNGGNKGKRAGRISRDERLMVFAGGWDVALRLLAEGYAGLQGDVATLPKAYLDAHETAQDAAIGIHADTNNNAQKPDV